MKRLLMVAILMVLVVLCVGCGCRHEWRQADCSEPKRCRICGQRDGEPLGHNYESATCESPKTCTLCGKTDGAPAGHSWQAATCHAPETCAACGLTRGEMLTHQWEAATCARPEICILCEDTRGEPGAHSWVEADCVNPKYCTACAAIGSAPNGHTWISATCLEPRTCSVCAATEGKAMGHAWTKVTCTAAQTCNACGAVGKPALGHSWNDATCVLPICCAYCDATQGEALGHEWEEATPDRPKTCKICGETEGLPVEMDDRFISENCEPLFGSWQYRQVTNAKDLSLPGFDQDMVEIITYRFGPYGTLYITTIVEDPEIYRSLLVGYSAAAIYRAMEEEGMDAEEADAHYLQEYDMTILEYAQMTVDESDWENDMNISEELCYYVEDGTLYIAQHWEDAFETWSFAVEADDLTLTDEWAGEELALTRVDAA